MILAGVADSPIPNPEAIGEFKVATSLYDASLGSKGGGALGLVLQQGTKGLHFEGWWYNRNDDYKPTTGSGTIRV